MLLHLYFYCVLVILYQFLGLDFEFNKFFLFKIFYIRYIFLFILYILSVCVDVSIFFIV